MHFEWAIVLLSCLSLACHGKRSAAAIDRAAVQQFISQADGKAGGETLLVKFGPLTAAPKLPSSVAGNHMTRHMRKSNTNMLGPSYPKLPPRALPVNPSKALLSANAAVNGTTVRQPLVGALPKTVPLLRPGSKRKHSQVGMQMVLERQGAPPAPPRGPPSGFGGFGNGFGDGNKGVLQTMTKAEAEYFLTDWMKRAQVYKMDAGFGNVAFADPHDAEITKLERLERFVSANTGRDAEDLPVTKWEARAMSTIVALYELSSEDTDDEGNPVRERERILAIASVEISKERGVVVIDMVVNPAEVKDLSSKAHIEERMGRDIEELFYDFMDF